MALHISSIQSTPQFFSANAASVRAATQKSPVAENPKSSLSTSKEAQADANTRLSLSVNSKLDEVVVKVIDTGTDKVVREIPAKELQNVYERIREVMGLMFDRNA